MSTDTSALTTFRTKGGATNYVKRLGFVPGADTPDTVWNGSESVAVMVRFDVEPVEEGFAVVRTVVTPRPL